MRKKPVPILFAFLVILSMIAAANFGQFKAIDYGVGLDAKRKALQWSGYLAGEIPDIEQLLATGAPTPVQAAKIDEAVRYGDVFGFRLYDETGRNVLSSYQTGKPVGPATLADGSEPAVRVLQTGEDRVLLIKGTQPDEPALYAEAFVPVRGIDGNVIGVAQVFHDQTDISNGFTVATIWLALILSVAFTLALSLLYLAFSIKKRQESQVRRRADYLAKHDLLSSLHNRSGFNDKLESMQRSDQFVPANTATIFLDVDNFKLVNDTYGHKTGDAFLSHVGAAISRSLEPQDTAGRLGGDEFVVVAQRPDLESARDLAEQLQALVSEPIRVNGTTITGNLSLGLHFGGEEGLSIEDRMTKADLALYQAKMDGRNAYRVFTPELEFKVLRRRKVESAILGGISNGLLAVHFQPLLRQTTRECVGFEALLRLTDSDGEEIHPEEFIPIAESNGAIKQLGAWVLARAAAAARDWPESLFVAVNLSARQFDDDDLVGIVERVIEDNGLAPARLELEVTESLLMQNTRRVGDQLAALRALGVSIAMDDFGTGYSSLGYLWKFGFDKLKIDRTFVAGLMEDGGRAREILDTIIILGHRLNMVVTAEGIETETQADILSGLSCDQVQGFLYGKPMPQSDLAAFMLKNTAEAAGQVVEAPDRRTGTG